MTVLTHTVNFYVTFGGSNDFVQSGASIISDNTITDARDEVRTIDVVTRSPLSADYTPINPLVGTSLTYAWWDYRKAEMWQFNLWDTSTTTLFANALCQTLFNSMHNKNAEWQAVYGAKGYGAYTYPDIDDLNVYIMWGYPLQSDKEHIMSEIIIVPYFYRGADPQRHLLITINNTTV